MRVLQKIGIIEPDTFDPRPSTLSTKPTLVAKSLQLEPPVEPV